MRDAADIINELVSIHGEEGVCPTADDWRQIFEREGPIHLLNLLKFRGSVEAADGAITGARAYARYSSGVAPVFARVGGELLFFAPVASAFGLGDAPAWDAAILTRYPSSRALADMWLDPIFIAAHEQRVDGVERSQVLVFGAEGAAYGVSSRA